MRKRISESQILAVIRLRRFIKKTERKLQAEPFRVPTEIRRAAERQGWKFN